MTNIKHITNHLDFPLSRTKRENPDKNISSLNPEQIWQENIPIPQVTNGANLEEASSGNILSPVLSDKEGGDSFA